MPDYHQITALLIPLGQVIIIDLMLAGDNAIVVGMAAAGLPKHMRNKVIVVGIIAATAMRILFALVANQLLVIVGLTLAGGILLLWVCWKFWRELVHERKRRRQEAARRSGALGPDDLKALGDHDPAIPVVPKTMRQAVLQIVLADISMSLDNVLAVAGAAEQHTWVLVVGLLLSVGLMGIAASIVAGFMKRYPWVAFIGLGIILWVAVTMIYRGSTEVMDQVGKADTHGMAVAA
jgi:YjbE family integral membrane protein